MNRSPVESRHLSSIGHDPESSKLEVEFKNGAVWRYHDVSEDEYERLLASQSRGTAFHSLIRRQKRGTQVL